MRRLLRGAAAAIMVLLALVVLAGVVLTIRLATGPVALGPLGAWLTGRLQQHAGDFLVELGEPQLAWSAKTHDLVLRSHDVAIKTPSGLPLVRAATVDIALDPIASLELRNIVISTLTLDGVIVDLGQVPRGNNTSSASRGLVDQLLEPEAGDPDVRAIVIEDGRIDFETGAKLPIERCRIERIRSETGPGLRGNIALAGGAAILDAHRSPTGAAEIDVEATDIDAAMLAAPFVSGIDPDATLRLNARASTSVAVGSNLAPVTFATNLASAELALPGLLPNPVHLDALEAQGTVDPAQRSLQIDGLELRMGSAHVDGHVTANAADDGVHVAAHAQGESLDIEAISALWPIPLAPDAREWVTAHVQKGVADNVTFDITSSPTTGGDPRFELAFAVRKGLVNGIERLPPLRDLAGHIEVTDERFIFDATEGEFGGLVPEDTRVQIAFMDNGPDRLELRGRLIGEVPKAVALVTKLPGGVALPVRPEQTAGKITADLRLGLPLLDDLPRSEVTVALEAKLDDLRLEGLADGIILSGGDLRLVVDDVAATANGDLLINGLPTRLVDSRVELGSGTHTPGQVVLEATPDRGDLSSAGLPDLVREGRVMLHAVITLPDGAPPELAVRADLQNARVEVPPLGVTKPIGTPGNATFGLHRVDGGIELPDFSIDMPQLRAQGRARMREDGSLAALKLRSFTADDTRLTASVDRQVDGSLKGQVEAKSLDLRRALKGQMGSIALPSAGPDGGSAGLDLEMTADKILMPGGALQNVQLDVVRTDAGWRSIAGSGEFGGGERLTVSLAPPQKGAQSFDLRAGDAGGLIGLLLSDTSNSKGGKLRLRGTLESQQPLKAHGLAVVRDFTIEGAPVLAQVLTLASLTGIVNTLQGNGISFDRARMDFALDGPTITITDGRAHGSALGITTEGTLQLGKRTLALSGTVVPFYTLNHLLGQIPIVGDLLADSDAGGVFAATYNVTGNVDAPDVNVNPLSALVPSSIREIFGKLAPAEEHELDSDGD